MTIVLFLALVAVSLLGVWSTPYETMTCVNLKLVSTTLP